MASLCVYVHTCVCMYDVFVMFPYNMDIYSKYCMVEFIYVWCVDVLVHFIESVQSKVFVTLRLPLLFSGLYSKNCLMHFVFVLGFGL